MSWNINPHKDQLVERFDMAADSLMYCYSARHQAEVLGCLCRYDEVVWDELVKDINFETMTWQAIFEFFRERAQTYWTNLGYSGQVPATSQLLPAALKSLAIKE